ncbi:MAG: anaerobic ribonucleoside-triphosphate reductase activating protein [Lachnospiraceae bacterium]|nr:anaerobic ribonucleoside-triphosphate reductase activating protein [Lachnospiraceae bacterium]
MQIHGLNKTTLLDYPGHVGATIFLGGCNFRCPFCHNRDLVLYPSSQPVLSYQEVIQFLKKRYGILTGVCITGGEPTLQPDLPRLVKDIKDIGYLVKLDTNGTNPEMIHSLHIQHLIDYVAMDIKTCPLDYANITDTSTVNMDAIYDSVDYLMHSGIAYEFRTTVVKEFHNADTFEQIANWIAGCNAYYLQDFKNSDTVIHQGYHSCSKEELESYVSILKKHITHVALRGID